MKKLWTKIQILIAGLFVPLWGIAPIIAGIYCLCILHRYTPWVAILIFLKGLLLIVVGSLIAYGIGSFITGGITSDEDKEENVLRLKDA